MKHLALLLTLISLPALALNVGSPAPDFSLEGAKSEGKMTKLSDYKGKIVILEWLNHGCPFVRKHYDSGNIPGMQKKYTEEGVVWLSIISSAPGKQGHSTASEAIAEGKKYASAATDILLDPTGKVGKMYEAKTTPHMYVIDQNGTLVYQGAIDDKPDTDQASIPGARNYVDEAIAAVKSGKKISAPSTKAYGCTVKY